MFRAPRASGAISVCDRLPEIPRSGLVGFCPPRRADGEIPQVGVPAPGCGSFPVSSLPIV